MKINVDFVSDWKVIQYNWLKNNGFRVDPKENDQQMSLYYFNVLKRWIPSKPRSVLISRELRSKENYQEKLAAFIHAVQKGDDINKFQSRKILKPDYKDMLLFDWDIYHFHLGNRKKDGFFVERTELLLFAMVDESEIYFIDIMPHNNWTNRQLLQIVNNNWPYLLEHCDSGFIEMECEISDEDLSELREIGVSAFVKLENGKYYCSPGGGYTMKKHSSDVFRKVNRYRRIIRTMQDSIFKNIEKINAVMPIDEDGDISINLVYDQRFYAYIDRTNLVIEFIRNEKSFFDLNIKCSQR